MTVSIMKSNYIRVKVYRNSRNCSSDPFREYLLSKLSVENISTSASFLEKFLNICVSSLDNCFQKEKVFSGKNMRLINQTLNKAHMKSAHLRKSYLKNKPVENKITYNKKSRDYKRLLFLS